MLFMCSFVGLLIVLFFVSLFLSGSTLSCVNKDYYQYKPEDQVV